MSFRKTVDVSKLIDKVNSMNAKSTCEPIVRVGWNSLMESILMECNVYKGFGYLKKEDVPFGHKPGIHKDENEIVTFPDETRIYFVKDRRLE